MDDLRGEGAAILRDPADMPWGERVGFVADPDGNPVALPTRPHDDGLAR
jgi:lactoylglutathione lyase